MQLVTVALYSLCTLQLALYVMLMDATYATAKGQTDLLNGLRLNSSKYPL